MRWAAFLAAATATGLTAGAQPQAPRLSETAAEAHARGVESHNARRLDDASREYSRRHS
jgi:hypothetical protein